MQRPALSEPMEQEDESVAAAAGQQAGRGGGAEEQLAGDLLHDFERILHSDPLIDEVGFLHPTQFGSLGSGQDGDSASEAPGFHNRYFWCRDHKLAISSDILPELYRAARDAYYNARNAQLPVAHLMSHTKALLILCPDLLTAWNSRKRVLSEKYDFTKLKDELQLCALILSYSPKNESTWSHRRWVLKQVAEKHQDMAELIEKESVLVKEIAEKSKMNYRAWRHRCWLIPYMTRNQVLDELKKSTRWSELHVADNCCFHYRRSLLLALLDSRCLENREDSLRWESETRLLWKEELRWDETLIRRYQGRESLWNHRRFLSQQWIQQLLAVEETCRSTTSEVDLFITQEIGLLSECLNDPADEFEESRVQAELSALYVVWISKAITVPPQYMPMPTVQMVLGTPPAMVPFGAMLQLPHYPAAVPVMMPAAAAPLYPEAAPPVAPGDAELDHTRLPASHRQGLLSRSSSKGKGSSTSRSLRQKRRT